MTNYRYIGIFLDNTPRDRPLGVIRVWTGADGMLQEEVFVASLNWESSMVLATAARPDNFDYIEIEEPIVEKFIDRAYARFGGE
jgi:hypothetical protein